MSAGELAENIRGAKVTACSAIGDSVDTISRLDPSIKAFITVQFEKAMEEAENIDSELRQGHVRGPLAGVPIAIKDIVDTAGMRTTYGSRLREEYVPQSDNVAVARLKAAGAVVIGKTNTPEFGLGHDDSYNDLCGPTTNPYDPSVTAGASSGGSAAAVASGMVSLADGTDFGGSVRQPAAYCGIVGIRPTPGIVPIIDKPRAWDRSIVHGCFGRSVEDVALMLGVMAGPHPADGASLTPVWSEGKLSTARIRVAASRDLGITNLDTSIADAFERCVSQIEQYGVAVVRDHPDCSTVKRTFQVLRAVHLRRDMLPIVRGKEDRVSARLIWEMDQGTDLTIEDYLYALEEQSRIYRTFMSFFETCDFLLTPTAAVPPFASGAAGVKAVGGVELGEQNEYHAITYAFSLVGFPCLSIPCGWKDGLPVGLQIVGRPFDDARLLEFAAVLQNQLDYRHRFPEDVSHHIPQITGDARR
jgi:amidase